MVQGAYIKMIKVLVRYESGVKADFYTLRKVLRGVDSEPSRIIGRNDSYFELRYPVVAPSKETLKDTFKSAGLEVRSVEVMQ